METKERKHNSAFCSGLANPVMLEYWVDLYGICIDFVIGILQLSFQVWSLLLIKPLKSTVMNLQVVYIAKLKEFMQQSCNNYFPGYHFTCIVLCYLLCLCSDFYNISKIVKNCKNTSLASKKQFKCEENWNKQKWHSMKLNLIFLLVFPIISLYPFFVSLICLFHPLHKNIWRTHSCNRQCSDNRDPVFWSTHNAHTERKGRKQLKDVIGQMRITGLWFGLGHSEYLAAVRQRHAIRSASFLPPTCSVRKWNICQSGCELLSTRMNRILVILSRFSSVVVSLLMRYIYWNGAIFKPDYKGSTCSVFDFFFFCNHNLIWEVINGPRMENSRAHKSLLHKYKMIQTWSKSCHQT